MHIIFEDCIDFPKKLYYNNNNRKQCDDARKFRKETRMNDFIIERNKYLNQLISKRENRLIKIITGVRRCGKSFLLFTLYRQYLQKDGVDDNRIITMELDNALNAVYRDPMVLSEYLNAKITDTRKMYYVFLDEIQYVQKKKISDNPEIVVTFYDVLNALLQNGIISVFKSRPI